MKTKMVSSIVTGNFEGVVNEAIEEHLCKEIDLVEKHNCTEHIEYGEHEFVDGVVFFYGRCKKCGKELVETYRYEDTRDRETDAVMSEKKSGDNFIFAKLKKVFEYVETRVEKRKGESD